MSISQSNVAAASSTASRTRSGSAVLRLIRMTSS
jgi:hypothetical protein